MLFQSLLRCQKMPVQAIIIIAVLIMARAPSIVSGPAYALGYMRPR